MVMMQPRRQNFGFLALIALCFFTPSNDAQATDPSNNLRRQLKQNKNKKGGSGVGSSLRPMNGEPVYGPEQLAALQGQTDPTVTVTVTNSNGQMEDRTQVGQTSTVINTNPNGASVNSVVVTSNNPIPNPGGGENVVNSNGSNGAAVTSVVVNGEVYYEETPNRFDDPSNNVINVNFKGGDKKGGNKKGVAGQQFVAGNNKKKGGDKKGVSGTGFTHAGQQFVSGNNKNKNKNKAGKKGVAGQQFVAGVSQGKKKMGGMKRKLLPTQPVHDENYMDNNIILQDMTDIEFRLDMGEDITPRDVDDFLEHFNRARALMKGASKMKGIKRNQKVDQDAYTIAVTSPTTSANFVGFTSFAKNGNKNKKAGGKNGFHDPNISRDQWLNEYGVAETKPCVTWDFITENQKINPSSSDACRDLSNGYPFNGGCCRSYWWLIMDSGGTSNPSIPCICNSFTRDPSSWAQKATQSTILATPSPTTPAPTPVPTLMPSSEPTTSAPSPEPSTTSNPEPVDVDRSEILEADPPSLDTCFNWDNIQHWNPVAFPELADRTRCTSSDHCIDVPNACCLGEFCLCGLYRDSGTANQDCVPLSDGMTMEEYLGHLTSHSITEVVDVMQEEENQEQAAADPETQIDALRDQILTQIVKPRSAP